MKEQENAFDKKESYLEISANEKYILKYNICYIFKVNDKDTRTTSMI